MHARTCPLAAPRAHSHACALTRAGARRLGMPHPPEEMFEAIVDRVVQANIDYVPPHGARDHSTRIEHRADFRLPGLRRLGRLAVHPPIHVRPRREDRPRSGAAVLALRHRDAGRAVLQGRARADRRRRRRGARARPPSRPSPAPADIAAALPQSFDRAAPRGVGNIKAAGNYAPDVLPSMQAKERGYPVCLYLDAATQVATWSPHRPAPLSARDASSARAEPRGGVLNVQLPRCHRRRHAHHAHL